MLYNIIWQRCWERYSCCQSALLQLKWHGQSRRHTALHPTVIWQLCLRQWQVWQVICSVVASVWQLNLISVWHILTVTSIEPVYCQSTYQLMVMDCQIPTVESTKLQVCFFVVTYKFILCIIHTFSQNETWSPPKLKVVGYFRCKQLEVPPLPRQPTAHNSEK